MKDYRYGKVRKMTKEERKNAIESRIIPVIASTSDKDRHGSILNQANWQLENFRANPIIGYQHNVYGGNMCGEKESPDDIIGKGINARVEGGDLLVDIQFKPEGRSELADKTFSDMAEGYLNAVSVGFLPVPDEEGNNSRMGNRDLGEDPTIEYFFGQELLELSVVNIPSNPAALQNSLRKQTDNAILFVRKATGLGFGDIEKMTIGEVVKMIESPNKKQLKEPEFPKDEIIIDGNMTTSQIKGLMKTEIEESPKGESIYHKKVKLNERLIN